MQQVISETTKIEKMQRTAGKIPTLLPKTCQDDDKYSSKREQGMIERFSSFMNVSKAKLQKYVVYSGLSVIFLFVCCRGTWQSGKITSDEILEGQKILKSKICERDYLMSRPALQLVNISTEPSINPRILCFVNTISTNYARAKSLYDTWGKKCDKLVFASNVTDDTIGAVKIDAISDHDHLWQKHKETLKYVWKTYRNEYDWFYKADDDAFVIVENLKLYLRSPEIVQAQYIRPLQLGHRFKLTEKLIDYYIVNKTLRHEFKANFGRWIFNSGGPGYAMNRLYMEKVVGALNEWKCLSDKYSVMLPDDAAISFCMAWYNGIPINTRDSKNRERFHADKPAGVYFTNPNQPNYWFIQYHEGIGGYQWKEDCCSNETIAFHYIKPDHMYYLARELYFCRSNETSLESLKQNSNMHIPARALIPSKRV